MGHRRKGHRLCASAALRSGWQQQGPVPLVRGDWLCLTGIAATGRTGQTYARHVQVHETNLKQLVQGEKQFRVPLWQRQYTWRITDHRLLWRDILEHTRRPSMASP